MIPSRLFRNRWSALFWAGGVLWFAYDVASAAPQQSDNAQAAAAVDATGEPINAADLEALANAG